MVSNITREELIKQCKTDLKIPYSGTLRKETLEKLLMTFKMANEAFENHNFVMAIRHFKFTFLHGSRTGLEKLIESLTKQYHLADARLAEKPVFDKDFNKCCFQSLSNIGEVKNLKNLLTKYNRIKKIFLSAHNKNDPDRVKNKTYLGKLFIKQKFNPMLGLTYLSQAAYHQDKAAILQLSEYFKIISPNRSAIFYLAAGEDEKTFPNQKALTDMKSWLKENNKQANEALLTVLFTRLEDKTFKVEWPKALSVKNKEAVIKKSVQTKSAPSTGKENECEQLIRNNTRVHFGNNTVYTFKKGS